MLNISVPNNTQELKPKITVIGVGGAGGNAVNNMIDSKLEGVEFVVANTDGQALGNSKAGTKIQLGLNVTSGLGAGSKPEIGKEAAEESLNDIMEELGNSNMVFITAGLGGGTGTGAAPVIAKASREKGILTVCVVTKPFEFEGAHRKRIADKGIEEIQKYADTLIIIPNQNLFRLANEKTSFADAFNMADNVLYQGVSGVTDLIVKPGQINLDFADIKTVMSEMGKAMMGTGESSSENRSIEAVETALKNPILDEINMKGAKAVLINITGGKDMTLLEVDEAANRIRQEIDPDANIIFGSTTDESLEGSIKVSLVATGIQENNEIKFTESSKVINLDKEINENSLTQSQNDFLSKINRGSSKSFEKIINKENETFNEKKSQVSGEIKENETFNNLNEKLEEEPILPVQNNLDLSSSKSLEKNLHNRTFSQKKINETFVNKPLSKKSSFIDRITGFWKNKAESKENYQNELKRKYSASSSWIEGKENSPKSQIKEKQEEFKISKTTKDESVLEIPAFLRRQAN